MKEIIAFFKLMARRADYLLHHLAAEDIALLVFAVLVHFLPWAGALGVADAVTVAVAVLILKEAYDYFHPDEHSVELNDILSGLAALAYVNVIIVAIFAIL